MESGLTQTNSTNQVRDRIPVPAKIAYGLGTGLDMWGFWLYPGVAFAVFNMYLGVNPVLVGLALTLIRVYDAFTDPIAGWISDNFRSKHGRRRPFILIAGILSGLGLPALFSRFSILGRDQFSRSLRCFLVYAFVIPGFHPDYQHLHRAL